MKVVVLIILMGAVTYIPRWIPMFAIDQEKIPKRMKSFLSLIPYAALGALIMPGSIQAIEGKPWISLAAIIFTGAIVWFRENMIMTVLSSVAFTCLLLFLFGR